MESKSSCFRNTKPAGRQQGMPLALVQAGRQVKFIGVDAGHALKSRLAALGLVPGVEIHVLKNSRCGPFLVEVMGSRIVLGRGMALRTVVE